MTDISQKRSWAVAHILVFIFLSLRYYINEIKRGGNVFTSADWLVSYHSGFVRRGAIGAVFELFSNGAVGAELLFYLFIFQSTLVLGYFFCMYKLIVKSPLGLLSRISIFVSPFYILFWITNPLAYLRKEIIALLAVSYFAYLRIGSKQKESYFYAGIFLMLIAGLSHESAIIIVPVVLHFIYQDWKEGKISLQIRNLRICLVSAVALMIGIVALQFRWLSPSFCVYIKAKQLDPEFCNEGGIAWAMHPEWWHSLWQDLPSTINFYLPSLPLIYFALAIPLITLSTQRTLMFFWVLPIISIPVFLSSYDWGRWIFMIGNSIITIILTEKSRKLNKTREWILRLALPWVFLVSLPFCCSRDPWNGLLKYVIDVINF